VKVVYALPEVMEELEYLKEEADEAVGRLQSLLQRRENGEDVPDEIIGCYGGFEAIRLSSRYEKIDREVVYRIRNNREDLAFAIFEREG